MTNDSKLTTNFALSEFVRSYTASVQGIENVPTTINVNNLRLLCEKVLQPLRDYLCCPIHITSGYRSRRLNTAVGGTKNSKHLFGLAADFVCPRLVDAYKFLRLLKAKGIVKELIMYEGTFIHVSI